MTEGSKVRAGWFTLNIIFCVLAGSLPLAAVGAEPGSSGGDRIIVNAVFQSERGGMALIDGVARRPGDRVHGAEILAIERGAVRLRTGDGEYVAWVGSDLAQGYTPLPETSAAPEPVWVAAEPDVRGNERPPPGPAADEPGIHTVAYGDTLSAIANRYRPAGMTLESAISALFEANSATIGDDIDQIYTGSRLRIPEFRAPADAAGLLADASLAVEPSTETLEPEPLIEPLMQSELLGDEHAAPDPPEEHVPVMAGDTLSGIAQKLKVPGVSSEQVMQALYEANPDAFGGSMDLLFAGEILQVPVSMRPPPNGMGGDEVLAQLDR